MDTAVVIAGRLDRRTGTPLFQIQWDDCREELRGAVARNSREVSAAAEGLAWGEWQGEFALRSDCQILVASEPGPDLIVACRAVGRRYHLSTLLILRGDPV